MVPTFGRWFRSKKDNKCYFITGTPSSVSGHVLKQPVLELYSWKEFVDSGRMVRVAL